MATQSLTTNGQTLPRRLILGFVALASAAVIGAVSLANAAPAGKPTKAECAAAGKPNYGQCVSEWAQNKAGYNGGGGNNNIVNTNLNVGVSGDENVVSIVLSYVFGG